MKDDIKTVDARGFACPQPVLLTRTAYFRRATQC